MKGAQLGVTEVAINRAFFVLDILKRDVLYVLPTALNAGDFSKARFGPALSLSPYLQALFTDTNTVNLKRTATNTLYIRGSRGDSNLKSVPVSELILDELDEMDLKQVELAVTRLDGSLIKHVLGISTPTIPNKGIHKYYQTTTQEKFVFKCPRCSQYTELVWPDSIEIIGEHVADPRCTESFLKCKECKGRLEHLDKPHWLSSGRWEVTNLQGNPDVRGFVLLSIGDSLLKDVCDHQVALLNLGSSDVNYALRSNFPFYIEQRDMRQVGSHLKPVANADGTATSGGQAAANQNIEVGATVGRAYDLNAQPPAFIAPPSHPLEASMKLQEKLENDIRKLVQLAVVNLAPRASAESKQRRPGTRKRTVEPAKRRPRSDIPTKGAQTSRRCLGGAASRRTRLPGSSTAPKPTRKIVVKETITPPSSPPN
jgi:hypothetical protein